MPKLGLVIGQLTWGGAERQLYELAIRIEEKGWVPHVYCLSGEDKPYREMLESRGIRVRLLSRSSHFDLSRAFRLRQVLREDGIDLAHSWLLNDNAYTAVSQIAGSLPWIASLRSRPTDRDPLRTRIDKWAFARSQGILVNEPEIVSYLCERYRCPPSKVVVVPNGIDLERLRQRRSREEVRKELETPLETPVILSAGRLEAVKNIPLLLDSFSELLKAGKDARLWIVGDGAEKDAIIHQIEKLSLREKVLMTGVRADLPDLLHAADVFVLCSHSEGLPNVVLEAMGCGLPVIVSPHSGCREAIEDGTSGWISPDQRPDSYCRLLSKCLENAEEMRRIGENARAVVQNRYSPDEMVCRMASFYSRILKRPDRKGCD